jgi:hypothetical protein
MDLIISILLSTRLLSFLTGLPAGGSDVRFIAPRVIITPHEIALSCSLHNAYTPQLRELAQTGTPILLYLFSELYEHESGETVRRTIFESSLSYDIAGKRYLVVRSGAPDTLSFAGLDSAASVSCWFPYVPVAPLSMVRGEGTYHISVQAILGKTQVEALRKRDIDLMYYWDFKRPSMRTGKFTGRQFLSSGEAARQEK